MALTDITFSIYESTMARWAIGSVTDIIMLQSFSLPLITWSGGGGGFSVLSSPIIKAIKVWR